MGPVSAQSTLMLGLVSRGVQNCEGDAEQLFDESARRFVATPALEPEVIAQPAPCRLWKVGVAVSQEIIATGFARKHHGAALMNMKIGEGRGEDRLCLRILPRLRNRQQKFIALPIGPIFRTRSIKQLCVGLVVDEALIERKRKKTENFRLVETDPVQVLPNSFGVVSRDREFAFRSSGRSKLGNRVAAASNVRALI
jgi:hypothetical protein